MPNRVIVKSKKVEEVNRDGAELRRINAILEHKDVSEDELKHSGVMGMHWGVRNGSSSDGGSSGSKRNILQKAKDIYDKPDKDFAEATKGMSKAKAFGIYMALGPHWGAKAINSAKAKAADPKEIVKKETKALRKSIANEWAKKSDAELVAHEAEFKAKYGKGPLNPFSKVGAAENRARADAYTSMLTKRMEKTLTEVADSKLAGTGYKLTKVAGFNDFLPEFEITKGD